MADHFISIVIPAKNEEPTIEKIISRSLPHGNEVVLVDGHSSDQTRQIAEKVGARVVLDHGKGKGDAIREAIKQVKGDIIVFLDADGSHNPDDIPKLLQPILKDEADLVIGSRMLGGSDELYGTVNKFIRESGSHIITLGINYRFGVQLTDSQNGFRVIRTDVARSLNLQENITTIEQEMTIKCVKKGFRLAEVPCHEYKREFGESVILLRKVWFRYLFSWIKYLFT